MRKLVILGLVLAGSAALAQEPPPPPPGDDFAPRQRKRPDRGRGKGGFDPAKMLRSLAGAKSEVEIAAHGDSVYVVMGRNVFRVAAKTMKEAARGTLEDPETDAAEDTEMRERLMKRMDKDGDGEISREEFPKPEMFDRADRNRDGAVTLDELRVPQAMRRKPGGPVKIIAGRSAVYVLRGNVLYKLDADDLTIMGSVTLEPPEAKKRKRDKGRGKKPGGEFGGGGDRGDNFEF